MPMMTDPFPEPQSPPATLNTVKELLAPIEWLGTLVKIPTFKTLPTGNRKPIMLAPGYLADEWSMLALKRFLTRLNYRVYDWGLGRNTGEVDELIEKMAEQISVCQQQNNLKMPVTLIGWSLGGVVSREVARLYPEQVAEVITLGSPITGGPKYTIAAKRYAKRADLNLDEFEQHVLARNKIGFSQPVTSIYSKTDGVVSWQAAVDVYNPQARNIEVKASHLGLVMNAEVWRILASILAENRNL